MTIGPFTVEYAAKYPHDLARYKELLAQIDQLAEVQATMQSPGWKVIAKWAKGNCKKMNDNVAALCDNMHKNKNEILALRRRRNGLTDWMLLFNKVALLPKMQQELQDIEDRLEK